jgi:hypothetical protein
LESSQGWIGAVHVCSSANGARPDSPLSRDRVLRDGPPRLTKLVAWNGKIKSGRWRIAIHPAAAYAYFRALRLLDRGPDQSSNYTLPLPVCPGAGISGLSRLRVGVVAPSSSFCVEPGNAYSYTPPTPLQQRSLDAYVRAEESFYSRFEDPQEGMPPWLAHTAAAMNAQDPMWVDFTGNSRLVTWYAKGGNFGGSTCTSHLAAFSYWLANNVRQDFNLLVTGRLTNRIDCALGHPSGEAGCLSPWPDSLVYGLDHGPYHGFTSATHFGLLMAEEHDHSGGEPAHPCERVNSEVSTMCGTHSH